MFFSTFAAFCLLGSTAALPHTNRGRAHRGLRRDNSTNSLVKRSYTGRGTWYDTGLGACGEYNKPSDYIVALNAEQFGGGYPGPNCFKFITISANGLTIPNVQIMDKCPGCPYGALDLSHDLFARFGGDGVIEVTWWFEGEGEGKGNNDDHVNKHVDNDKAHDGGHKEEPISIWVEPTTTPVVWVEPTTTWVPPSSSSEVPSSSFESSTSSSSVTATATGNSTVVPTTTAIANTTATVNTTTKAITPTTQTTTSTIQVVSGISIPTTKEVETGTLQGMGSLMVQLAYLVVAGTA